MKNYHQRKSNISISTNPKNSPPLADTYFCIYSRLNIPKFAVSSPSHNKHLCRPFLLVKKQLRMPTACSMKKQNCHLWAMTQQVSGICLFSQYYDQIMNAIFSQVERDTMEHQPTGCPIPSIRHERCHSSDGHPYWTGRWN